MNILINRNILKSIPKLSMGSSPRYNFSLIGKVRNQITSGSIYRGIAIVASIQLIATYTGSYLIDRGITMSLADFQENTFLKENQQFQLAGIIKPGTFQVMRGTLESKFMLTDFQSEVEVFYRGQTKFEFKEGETMVLTAYLPDITNKKKIIGIDYLTKHSMDGTNWQDRIETSRQNFGINTRMQSM